MYPLLDSNESFVRVSFDVQFLFVLLSFSTCPEADVYIYSEFSHLCLKILVTN